MKSGVVTSNPFQLNLHQDYCIVIRTVPCKHIMSTVMDSDHIHHPSSANYIQQCLVTSSHHLTLHQTITELSSSTAYLLYVSLVVASCNIHAKLCVQTCASAYLRSYFYPFLCKCIMQKPPKRRMCLIG